jgi:hypothetical protein
MSRRHRYDFIRLEGFQDRRDRRFRGRVMSAIDASERRKTPQCTPLSMRRNTF